MNTVLRKDAHGWHAEQWSDGAMVCARWIAGTSWTADAAYAEAVRHGFFGGAV